MLQSEWMKSEALAMVARMGGRIYSGRIPPAWHEVVNNNNNNNNSSSKAHSLRYFLFAVTCGLIACTAWKTTVSQLQQEEPILASRAERKLEARYPLSNHGMQLGADDDYDTFSSFSSDGDERHKVSRHRNLRIIQAQQIPVRLLSFGSSSTWGEGLTHVRHEAYPYLLDAQAINVASRVGGVTLAAACTQSMVVAATTTTQTQQQQQARTRLIVDNHVQDFTLVTMEFETFDESAAVLAKRLRKRFPAATLLWIQLWSPSQWVYKNGASVQSEFIEFEEWRIRHGNFSFPSSDLFHTMVASGMENFSFRSEHLPQETLASRRQLQEKIMAETGALLYQLPKPNLHSIADVQTLAPWFQRSAPYPLSTTGHEQVATGILNLLQSNELKRQRSQRIFDAPTGSWGSGDQCNLWYASGHLGSVRANHAPVNFAQDHSALLGQEQHKHALEFSQQKGASSKGGGSVMTAIQGATDRLLVNNPFDEDRMLYLTYMAGEESDYPKTRVRINGQWTVLVDPFHEHDDDNLHWTQTSAVGWLPAKSEATVELVPIRPSHNNFRLVGASLICRDMESIPMEYALEAEPVQADSREAPSLWSWR